MRTAHRGAATQRERPRSPSMLTVVVQPRARRTEVVGRHGDAIKIRLAAPPVDGAANDELIRFLAARLGVPKTSVRIARGVAGRRKRIEVNGGPEDPAGILTDPVRDQKR